MPKAKPACRGRDIQAVGAVVWERAGLKPAGVGKFAASRVKVGRLDLDLKVKGGVAAEAVRRRPPPIPVASGQAPSQLPLLTANPQLLVHLPPGGDHRVLPSAHSSTRQHPPTIAIAVPDEQDRPSVAQDAADAARPRPPKHPPASKQEERQAVPGGAHTPAEAHPPIIAAKAASPSQMTPTARLVGAAQRVLVLDETAEKVTAHAASRGNDAL